MGNAASGDEGPLCVGIKKFVMIGSEDELETPGCAA